MSPSTPSSTATRLHVLRATEAYNLGDGPAAENYLKVEKIIDVAQRAGAQAIHPGYGFLAENAPFAQACEEAGIVFIGPPASAIEAMGSKTRARALMAAAGVPIVPGTTEPVANAEGRDWEIVKARDRLPARREGSRRRGRQGLSCGAHRGDCEAAFEGASREGEKFFSDGTRLSRAHLPDPRHVEVQVLADRARQRDPPGGSVTARSSGATRS